ncbi:MAG: thiol oxidoreductase-like protein [Deltaproteobacteria bacterium]|nr:thiol oxidoreductase-like protein [Deltaproteobacteria bacterium]
MAHLLPLTCTLLAAAVLGTPGTASAQLIDRTQAPNAAGAGIAKSLEEQIGTGQGDALTPGSSIFLIQRDPARSIRRGRQLFQRKFSVHQGLGPRTGDGVGDIDHDGSIGAGFADSCAGCHGRPRGAAGFGGDVATRPDSRDAPHLFGLGLQEMLADEITADLRAIRDRAAQQAVQSGRVAILPLKSKGIRFGSIRVAPDGSVDTSGVLGVDPDLRVRPFFAQGGTISIREFLVGAFNAEMGVEASDPLLHAAASGARVVTPAGMVLDGSLDAIERPPAANEADDPDGDGVRDELPVSLVDHMEFYLLNYFKPAVHEQSRLAQAGRQVFDAVGCGSCHVPDLRIERDRRVADVETRFDPVRGVFNRLFATASLRLVAVDDGSGFASLKRPAREPFVVRNFFADLKRHDLGPAFHERNYDGTTTTHFMTEPLWGVGSTSPYGHDGRSISLREVVLRHGGEARRQRDAFAAMPEVAQLALFEFLESLVLFPPDDTASNLDPGDPSTPGFPQTGHGSIKLGALFNDPAEGE